MNAIQKKFAIQTFGSGENTILFAHGYGCNQSMWRYIVPHFRDRYKIVLYDLMGCGDSEIKYYDWSKYATLDGHAQDILEIIEGMSLSNVVFVGHSVSSMTGMLAAIQKPSFFSHLVMVCPSPCFLNDGDYIGGFTEKDFEPLLESLDSNYLGWTSAITPVISNRPDKPEVAEELKNSFCRNDPEIAKHFAKVTFSADHRKEVTLCATPTLIVQTVPDALAPVSVGEFMHKKMPNSVLKILNTPGHCPHLSDPEQLIQAMDEFLN